MENVVALGHKDLWWLLLLHVILAESVIWEHIVYSINIKIFDLNQNHHLTYGLFEFDNVLSWGHKDLWWLLQVMFMEA